LDISQEMRARLRLARSENVGPVTFRALLSRFGTAEAALKALPALARAGGRRTIRVASDADADREIARINAAGARLLVLGLAPYPSLLTCVEDAPPVLSSLGHLTLLDKPSVAIVGARNASAAGMRLARELAAQLGEAGWVVVSGLARGIDAAAHQGALANGTIAANAGGVDVIYPPENKDIHARICQTGLVLSEQPMGTEPQARHFPRRNRIISGLSRGVVVIEAAPKSGSLITARVAADQGREVMAVPGSPLDPRAQGCNQLIRDGATLVQSADDVLEALSALIRRGPAEPELPFSAPPPLPTEPGDSDRAALLALLSPTPVEVDELCRASALPVALVQAVLVELDLAGRIVRHAGQRVALRADSEL
jgi:DNA processing protein